MKLVCALFVAILATTISLANPVSAAEERILEPVNKPTTEQLTMQTLGAAHAGKACRHVRERKSLMEMFPAYLIDANTKKEYAEYKMMVLFGEVLRVSQLLPKDHPSKCESREFVASVTTGKLDVGAYGGCSKEEELRLSDAFYFDPKSKKRMGREHKLKWDIAFRRLMWRTHEIAAMCTG